MNVPIRMLGIATSIFWVILIAFIASAAYSLKDLSFGFGEPQFTAAPSHDLRFSLPIYIDNRGYYSLKSFNISTVFSDPEGSEISKASTFVPIIPQGQRATIFHNVTLSMDNLLEKGEQYLFNDTDLIVSVAAGVNFAELLPVQISMNTTYPWGAPFYNFTLGQPTYSRFNFTHGRITVPSSFENHAAFDLVGDMRVELYDSADSLLGKSQTALNVPQYSPYTGKLDFYVPQNSASLSAAQSGHFSVYFSTLFFEYGPVVIPYG
jgi:hypothetical protein